MKLRSLYVDGFGIWRQYSLPSVNRGLTVFHGPNEAGKSTLVAFLRWMFYGFAGGRSKEKRYAPLRGGRHGGWVEISGGATDEPLCRIERYRGSKPEVSLQSHDGVPRVAEDLPGLLGNVDRTVFYQVFAFSLDELTSFESLTTDQIKQRLYSAPMQGAGVAPQDVIATLEARRADLYTRNANSQAKANQLSRQLAEASARLRQAQSQVGQFQQVEEQIGQLAERITAKQQVMQDLTVERRMVGQLYDLWPSWRHYRDLQEQLAALPVVTAMPRDGDTRLTELEQRLERAQQSERHTQQEMRVLEAQLASLPTRDAVIDHRVELKGLHDRRMLVSDWLGKLRTLDVEVANAQRELSDVARQLGDGWTPERITSFDVSIAQQGVIREWDTRLQAHAEQEKDAARKLELSVGEHRRLQQGLTALPEAADQDLAAAKDRLAVETEAVTRLRTLLRDHERLAADCRHLESRIADLEATLAGMRQGPETPSAGGGSRLLIIAAAVMALAAFGLMGAGMMPAGIGLIVGAVVLGVIGLILGRQGTPAAQPGSATGAVEARLADCRQKRDAAGKERQAVEDQMRAPADQLGLALPLDPSQLDQADQRLRMAMLQVQGDVDRLQQRQSLIKQIEGQAQVVAGHEESLHAAQQAVTGMQEAWKAWKQEHGFDDSLNPATALALIDSVNRAQDLVARVANRLGERNATKQNVDDYAADVTKLVALLETQPPADPSAMVPCVEALYDRLLTAEAAEQKRTAAMQAIADLRPRSEREAAEVVQGEEELAGLLSEAGVETAERFRQAWQVWVERRRLEQAIQAADGLLKETLGDDEVARQIREKLATGERTRWEHERQELDSQLAELRDALEVAVRDHQSALSDRDRLAQSADVATAANWHSALQEELQQAVRQWRVIDMALSLVKATLSKYERDQQPAVLKRASHHFRMVTECAYDGVRARDQQIVVVDRNGGEHGVDTLSRGTAEQLYLCMRLGLAAEMAKVNGGLPLIMDDVLVNFDEERSRRVAEVLVQAGKELQILLFTCHESTVQAFRQADPDVALVSLPRYGGLMAPPATILVPDDDEDGDEGDEVSSMAGSRAAVDDARLAEVIGLIEAAIRRHPGQGKATIMDALAMEGVTDGEWRKAIDAMKADNRLIQVGNKRGAKYYLPDTGPTLDLDGLPVTL